METIRLKHGFALIDSEDYDFVKGFTLTSYRVPGSTWYVMTYKPGMGLRSLHRLLMDVTDPTLDVHHKNEFGFDNRRCNLMVLTKSEHQRQVRIEVTKGPRYNDYGYQGYRRWC